MTIRLLLFNPLSAGLAVLICLGIVWSLRQTSISTNQTQQAITEMEKEVQALNELKEQQEHQVREIDSPNFKEKVIRDELLLYKPGETVIQLPAMPSPQPTTTMVTPTPRPLQLWRDKLLLKF